MRTEFTDKGWRTIQTKNYNIKTLYINFTNREGWIAHTNKYGYDKNRHPDRYSCRCCGINWGKATGEFIHLCFMEKGKNQVICDSCKEKFELLPINCKVRQNPIK